jgi:peptide deformylase
MLKIITVPNPVLCLKAKKVAKIDQSTRQLVSEMVDFLKSDQPKKGPKGVGLAAPQIGQSIRIVVIWSTGSHQFLPMINPEIIWCSKRTSLNVGRSKNPHEGCLSVPGVWGQVRRYTTVKLAYQTPKGQKVIRRFKGLAGVIIQHEVDHLDGILFIDRIIEQKGKIIKQE